MTHISQLYKQQHWAEYRSLQNTLAYNQSIQQYIAARAIVLPIVINEYHPINTWSSLIVPKYLINAIVL